MLTKLWREETKGSRLRRLQPQPSTKVTSQHREAKRARNTQMRTGKVGKEVPQSINDDETCNDAHFRL